MEDKAAQRPTDIPNDERSTEPFSVGSLSTKNSGRILEEGRDSQKLTNFTTNFTMTQNEEEQAHCPSWFLEEPESKEVLPKSQEISGAIERLGVGVNGASASVEMEGNLDLSFSSIEFQTEEPSVKGERAFFPRNGLEDDGLVMIIRGHLEEIEKEGMTQSTEGEQQVKPPITPKSPKEKKEVKRNRRKSSQVPKCFDCPVKSCFKSYG